MRLLTNPIILRGVMTLLMAIATFALGWWLIRRMREEVTSEGQMPSTPRADSPGFQAAAYQGVIQQLKQQEEQSQKQRQAAIDRAVAAERLNSVLLSHVDSGVILFNRAGLVQQANEAARRLMGYSSMSGLSARDLFGRVLYFGWDARPPDEAPESIAAAVDIAIRQKRVLPGIQLDHVSPAGEVRRFSVTLAPVSPAGAAAACFLAERPMAGRVDEQVPPAEKLASKPAEAG